MVLEQRGLGLGGLLLLLWLWLRGLRWLML